MSGSASKKIGILAYATAGDKLPGDPGHPDTFNYPVEIGVVQGSYRDLIEGSEAAKESLIAAARALEKRGVCAIAGDCGLMALYQAQLADAVSVPVIASSLVLIPAIFAMLGRSRLLGVITGHSGLLGARHLEAVGASCPERLRIRGMEYAPHFRAVVIEGRARAEAAIMQRELLEVADAMAKAEPKLGALLIECSNLAAFGKDAAARLGIPVFDINTAISFLRDATQKHACARQLERRKMDAFFRV